MLYGCILSAGFTVSYPSMICSNNALSEQSSPFFLLGHCVGPRLTMSCQSNVLQECCHPSHASMAAMKTVVITLVASSSKIHGQRNALLYLVTKYLQHPDHH